MENSKKLSPEISRTIYVCKAFAIFLVVCAHCLHDNFSALTTILHCPGTLGVPLFFILSGLVMNYKDTNGVFWLKKLKRIVVPWFVWSLLTYCIHIIADNLHFDLLLFARWFIGYETWMYFCPMLLICFAVFRLSKSRAWVYALIVLGLLSNILTTLGVIPYSVLPVNAYLNPFNWFLYFGIGMLLKNVDIELLLNCKVLYKIIVWTITVLILITYCFLSYYSVSDISNWSPLSIPAGLFSALSIMFISYRLRNNRVLTPAGKDTFFVYFVHMQFGVSAFNILMNLIVPVPNTVQWYIYFVLYLIEPFAVFAVSYAILWVGKHILSALKLKRLYFVFGISD